MGPFPVSGPFPVVKGRLASFILEVKLFWTVFRRIKTVRLVVTGIFLDPFGFEEVVWVLVISPKIEFKGWKTFLNLGLVGGINTALLLREVTISAIVLELVMTSGL